MSFAPLTASNVDYAQAVARHEAAYALQWIIYRLSIGAAEVLAAEIQGSIAACSEATNDSPDLQQRRSYPNAGI
jgi:hypothetical protein